MFFDQQVQGVHQRQLGISLHCACPDVSGQVKQIGHPTVLPLLQLCMQTWVCMEELFMAHGGAHGPHQLNAVQRHSSQATIGWCLTAQQAVSPRLLQPAL